MRNIVEYLWQTDESLPIQLQGTVYYVCCHNFLVHQDSLRWYFFSKKQHKILKKKPQNTSVEQIVMHIQSNRRNPHAGLYVRTKDTLIQKRIINNSELVELLYSAKHGYLFVDLSMLTRVCAFSVIYTPTNINIQSTVVEGIEDILSKSTDNTRHQKIIRAGVLVMVEELQSKLTVGKSTVRQLHLLMLIDCQQDCGEPLIVLWSDKFLLSNDYYKLSFDYTKTKVAVSEVLESQEKEEHNWVCDGCKQKKYDKQKSCQVGQETAEKIRSHLNITKYGLTSRASFTICRGCTELVRSL